MSPDHSAALSPHEQRSLRCLLGLMIPASTAYSVPGADDDAIFADILASLGRDIGHAHDALRTLDGLAGGAFVELDPARRWEVAEAFRDAGGVPLMFLTRVILQCYYRDDRVMCSLGMEPRPPFPRGFEVEQGDWTLLDPVRARPAFYREAT